VTRGGRRKVEGKKSFAMFTENKRIVKPSDNHGCNLTRRGMKGESTRGWRDPEILGDSEKKKKYCAVGE